ncbi:tRNA pseudouridine(55) synthase TruB [Pantanalinema sp. GBBB05]|uniref:tRNA pseudouridine(55) synthase TruB n=1 Tax=Pantanalinema sp. GBBB05 TaxID=2604139 RepID=UPI001DAEBB01|nr:tRNA pseudouridine(55) synthase TruB [Pantanalinema sp. GBBB05]
MDGFLNLNKPAGFTSHDCVAKVRRLLKTKRVGHAGTLDPAATGVLPIAFGKATRLLQYLPSDKAYRATIQLGVVTTTDDLAGEVLEKHPVSATINLEIVAAALQQFQGEIQQIPPNYSAIQVQGKRLYDLARSGVEIKAQSRLVKIYKIEILDWRSGDFPQLDVAIACGSGTYIRAIARDLGHVLKTGGTLAKLLRTSSSGFDLTHSLTLEMLEAQIQAGTFQAIPAEFPLTHLPTINLPESEAKRWCQGQRIAIETSTNLPSGSILRVLDDNRQFLGIGQLTPSESGYILKAQMVFANLAEKPSGDAMK